MIFKPQPGQTVQIKYNKRHREMYWSWHSITGKVGAVADDYVNALVIFYTCTGIEIARDIIPRGNMFKAAG